MGQKKNTLDTSTLIHSNEDPSVLSEFFNFATNNNTACNPYNQIKNTETKTKKKVCLFLPGRLMLAKRQLRKILNRHFFILLQKQKHVFTIAVPQAIAQLCK